MFPLRGRLPDATLYAGGDSLRKRGSIVMGKIVAITGVNGYAAVALLQELTVEPDIEKIIGIDTSPWKGGWQKVEFVRKDICDPGLAEILRKVDVVCHLSIGEYGLKAGTVECEKAIQGTRNLLSACVECQIGKIICLGSHAVYGLSKNRLRFSSEEAILSEKSEDNGCVSAGVDIDAIIEAFIRSHPDITVTRFRAAPLIGPNIDNWLEQSLSMQFIGVPKGKENRIQFLHEEDLGRALTAAIRQDLPGIYNVAADDRVDLYWCFRYAGARVIRLPMGLAAAFAEMGYSAGIYPLNKDRLQLLDEAIAMDCQKLKAACGWQPAHDSKSAFLTYADKLKGRRHQNNVLQSILSWIIKSGRRLKPFLPVLETFRLGKVPGFRRFIPWLNPDQNSINYLPVNERIIVEDTILPAQVVHDLIESASVHVRMDKCGCRMLRNCQHYTQEVGCLFMGETALKLPHGVCRPVSKEEAHAHADRAMRLGLLPMIGKVRIDNFIYMTPDRGKLLSLCFCCDCCCILTSYKHVPGPYLDGIIEPIPGLVIEVTDTCVGCGACLETCAFNAITIENGRAVHNSQCRGCCRCERFCPFNAVKVSIRNDKYADEVKNRIRSHVRF